MEEEYILNRVDYLLFKSLIISLDAKEIMSTLTDLNAYKRILNTIDFTIKNDYSFFFLKNYLEKAQELLKLGNEKFHTKEEVRECEIDIMSDLNKINYTSKEEKNALVEDYLLTERISRMFLTNSYEEIYNSMACDYPVLYNLIEGMNDDKDFNYKSVPQVIATSSYLAEMMPELYVWYPSSVEKISKYLKENKDDNKYVNKCSRKIKRILKHYK